MLRNREKYHGVLESGPLNVFFVVIYNILCYLAVGIRSDPNVIAKPEIFEDAFVANWYAVLGQILVVASICLLVYTVTKRRAIGGQDTGKLLTAGIYSFSRHPVYFGIIVISLGIAIVRTNFDGMLVFPVIFLVNFIQAKLEETYDVGVRFKEEYKHYVTRTGMFCPLWLWVLIGVLLLIPLVIAFAS
jgi:protein-S-isoprenylcysteine O-methyltransferase Ste14